METERNEHESPSSPLPRSPSWRCSRPSRLGVGAGAVVHASPLRHADGRPPGAPSRAPSPPRASTLGAVRSTEAPTRESSRSPSARGSADPFGGQQQQAPGLRLRHRRPRATSSRTSTSSTAPRRLGAVLERRHLRRDARRHRPVHRPRRDQGRRARLGAPSAHARRLERTSRSATPSSRSAAPSGSRRPSRAGSSAPSTAQMKRAQQLHHQRLDPDRRARSTTATRAARC